MKGVRKVHFAIVDVDVGYHGHVAAIPIFPCFVRLARIALYISMFSLEYILLSLLWRAALETCELPQDVSEYLHSGTWYSQTCSIFLSQGPLTCTSLSNRDLSYVAEGHYDNS